MQEQLGLDPVWQQHQWKHIESFGYKPVSEHTRNATRRNHILAAVSLTLNVLQQTLQRCEICLAGNRFHYKFKSNPGLWKDFTITCGSSLWWRGLMIWSKNYTKFCFCTILTENQTKLSGFYWVLLWDLECRLNSKWNSVKTQTYTYWSERKCLCAQNQTIYFNPIQILTQSILNCINPCLDHFLNDLLGLNCLDKNTQKENLCQLVAWMMVMGRKDFF